MAYTVDDFKRDTFDLLIQELGPLDPGTNPGAVGADGYRGCFTRLVRRGTAARSGTR